MNARHQHAYTTLKLIPVVADSNYDADNGLGYMGIGSELPTLGTLMPMAILARYCKCGSYIAFEYGKRKDMVQLGKAVAAEQRKRAGEELKSSDDIDLQRVRVSDILADDSLTYRQKQEAVRARLKA